MQLSKTNFIQYLNCPNSIWLLKNKPDNYPHGEFSDYEKKIAAEGYEVEEYVKQLLENRHDANAYSYQTVFQTDRGLYAKADVTRDNSDGTINLYEVKSSTSVKKTPHHNQIKDAAFQKITAEDGGVNIKNIFIVHLNGDYERKGEIDPEQLLVFSDVSSDVAQVEEETRNEIQAALDKITTTKIDETSCTCLGLTRTNHCDAFDYFNQDIPKPSIYNLPRISKAKIINFIEEGRFDLAQIGLDEVTEKQALVLSSAQQGNPVINHSVLTRFYSKAKYPIYFLDYETYSSAIPLINRARPQSPIPFQYSLHVKPNPDDTEFHHFEYLSEEAVMPLNMIEHMEQNIGNTGSIISWHASFENTQNKSMAKLYPEKADFLNNLIERTLDLEDLFKDGYVDIAFGGSTSIKNVLPVLAADLTYEGMEVANGTDAMEAWIRFVNLPTGVVKNQLRKDMLEYCKLDTYAMVQIFEAMERV